MSRRLTIQVAWYAFFASGTSFLWQVLLPLPVGTYDPPPTPPSPSAPPSTSFLLRQVVRSDSLDYAQLRTGLREEGQYLQFWMLTQRFIGIFGNAIPFALLGQVGYVPNTSGDAPQNEDVGRVIGLLVNVMQVLLPPPFGCLCPSL